VYLRVEGNFRREVLVRTKSGFGLEPRNPKADDSFLYLMHSFRGPPSPAVLMPFVGVRFVTFICGFIQATLVNTRTGVLPIALVGVAIARLRPIGQERKRA
jgi:hypothetical protein